jgi:hypothetical protein
MHVKDETNGVFLRSLMFSVFLSCMNHLIVVRREGRSMVIGYPWFAQLLVPYRLKFNGSHVPKLSTSLGW